LGSFFAGIKAGTLGGIVYVGAIAVVSIVILFALKQDALRAIAQLNPTLCPTIPTVNGSAEDCFSSLVAVDVPFNAFLGFFIALLYAGIFGMYYDSLPGRNPTAKALVVAIIVGFSLVFFGFGGYVFNTASATVTIAALVPLTALYGYLLGRLYKKYTRTVEFSSQDISLLKILVDGRDVTGKKRTFATTSNHKLRADVSDDASFKEWAPSGGVSLEDQRSFDTVMEVNGDGTLNAKVGKKY
jgi:hypothetical protein